MLLIINMININMILFIEMLETYQIKLNSVTDSHNFHNCDFGTLSTEKPFDLSFESGGGGKEKCFERDISKLFK